MSFSVLEALRSSHEDMENIEKAMSMVLMEKNKHSVNPVSAEHALQYLVQYSQSKAKQALEIYADKDGMRSDDINALAGHRGDKKQGDVWTSFYDKVKEVKDYHRRPHVAETAPELQSAFWFKDRAFEADNSEALFSGEEEMGKRVDLHSIFTEFLNFKKITAVRRKKAKEALFARLQKKQPDLKPDDPIVAETFEEEFAELDYIEWLKTVDQFHEIPRYCKYKEHKYTEYLNSIVSYLKGLLLRREPLVGVQKLEAQFQKEFEERWNGRNILGWEEPTHKDKLFALPSNKLFATQGVMDSHKAGKMYKQKVEKLQGMGVEAQNELTAAVDAEDKRIAGLESLASKWADLLRDTIDDTVQYLQKKQSQTVEEMEMEKEMDSDEEDDGGVDVDGSDMEQDDEERPIYNPLNLPLGWDNKPIPFWLYKLHGLGIEYKCEICGNYSYWGRRAFEKHFSEWRHAFGMRCLKIPNTAHFKEITKIEEAIMLYDKLKNDAEDQTFRPDQDVECEDIQGNVMSQRAFEDLRRQGLI